MPDLWTVGEVCAYLAEQGRPILPRTFLSGTSRGWAPPPDERRGRTPLWRPETIRTWHENRPSVRPGRGNHTSGAQRTPGSRRRKT